MGMSVEGGEEMENYLLISDAAKEVKVESHVLRYWEIGRASCRERV